MRTIKRAILFLCLLTMLIQGIACHGADNENDPATFLAYLQAEAEKDNPDALCRLAKCYFSGTNGCEVDKEKASELFQLAAEHADNGIASAQFSKGMCYLSGYGFPYNNEKAFQWFRRAADQGFTDALFMLGLAYQKGLAGMPQSDTDAIKSLRKAAELGFSEAQYMLGVWYCTGTCGLSTDAAEGYKWIRLAAELGHPEAKEALGQFEFKTKTKSQWAAFLQKHPDSTGIIEAALDADLAKVKKLAQNDPSLLKKTFGEGKLTLLHIVSLRSDSIEVLKYLIEQNVDISAKDKDNWTPIVYAAGGKNHEAILFLLANGSLEPHKDCLDFPQEMKQLLMAHAVASAERRVVRTEFGSEYDWMTGDKVSYRKDYYKNDLSRSLSLQDQLIKERVDQCQRAIVEIAMAKASKDLRKYVLKK